MMETERLRICPATKEQMQAAVCSEEDADLKAAYQQMLDGCMQHPDEWEWYAMWLIELLDGTHIGDLCFKGLDQSGVAEIGYGILEAYQDCGYATEAVKAALAWAFQHPNVTKIEAETDKENKVSQKVLAKNGFLPNGTVGEEGPRFTLTHKRWYFCTNRC